MARKPNKEPCAQIPLCTFGWAPFLACSEGAQLAWLKMYASPEMRRTCVGLFPGGVAVLAERINLSCSRTSEILDELVEKRLVEHDAVNRITRFLTLPSRADRPDNGNCIVRWWKGFELLPRCRTRDSHVPFLFWLCQPLTDDHEEKWKTTFGTVSASDEVTDAWGTVYQVPNLPSPQLTLNEINAPVQGSPNPTIYDLRSTIYDPQGEEHEERERRPARQVETPRHLAEGTSPNLRPLSGLSELTGTSMLNAIASASGGRVSFELVDKRLLPDLESVAVQCSTAGVTLADLDLAGRFLRAGALAYRKDLGASWAARAGNVMELVGHARQWQKGELRLEGDADDHREPAPPSAFKTGLRAL